MKTILFNLSISTLFYLLFISYAHPVSAADCSEVAPNGNLVVTTGCMFSGDVNGVDSGIGAANDASLSVTTGGSLTVGATQVIAAGVLQLTGGSIVLFDGGQLKINTPLWMVDADNDSFPSTTNQMAQSSAPVNGIRRNSLPGMSIADTNDNQSCPAGTNPSGSCNLCQTGAIANQTDGQDIFSECQTYNLCNGAGVCSLHAKRIFLTSTTKNGNLGGLSGADSICQTRANDATLGGRWKAWLSSRTVSATSRLTHSTYPYLLVNQTTKVADNWTDLTDGTLDAAINRNQSNDLISGNIQVWTNTTASGGIFSTTAACVNWTSGASSQSDRYGVNTSIASAAWTSSGNAACNGARRLYCIEQ